MPFAQFHADTWQVYANYGLTQDSGNACHQQEKLYSSCMRFSKNQCWDSRDWTVVLEVLQLMFFSGQKSKS